MRCDIGDPACTRCRERGKECQYPSNAELKTQGVRKGSSGLGVEPTERPEMILVEEVSEGHVDVDMAVDVVSPQLLGDEQYFPTSITSLPARWIPSLDTYQPTNITLINYLPSGTGESFWPLIPTARMVPSCGILRTIYWS